MVIIKPSRKLSPINFRDLWRFRELAFFLIWRDVKVRYKQTVLGAAWAILQPLLQMIVFNFLFGDMAKIETGGIPRPLFTYSALLIWNLFSSALGDAARSLVASRNMITKVYFPRLIIPISSIFSGLVDFAIAFVVMMGMMIYYKTPPTAQIWTLPLFLILALVTATGVGLWLSALNVNYRDIRYVLNFLTQFWLLATPVAYPSSEIPEGMRMIYALNPMVGVVDGFRWAILGTDAGPGPDLWISIAMSIVLLVSGLYYFRSMEKTFADKV
ncbi:MAG: ABC transporter permease [Anaerolineales bacterium]|nr:ABC transporter permease [Anaerolineales bacterium]